MAVVELRLPALPEHVRTARLVVLAAARRAGLEDRYVDELRLALGEACLRAVGQHAVHAPEAPVVVTVTDHPASLSVSVTDQGPPANPSGGADSIGDDLLDAHDEDGDVSPDMLLALLGGLVDDVAVETGPGGTGTTVTMRWPLPVTLTPGTPSTSVAPA